MKWFRIPWILILVVSACSWLSPETIEPLSLLTPYVTHTPIAKATAGEPTEVIPTAAPSPTPTPFMHVLGANETISSIAYDYGLQISDILAINPELTPNALSVGTEILVPGFGSDGEDEANELTVISEPLALTVSEPDCVQTAENGLWCVAVVRNPLDQDAIGITLTFALKNGAGEVAAEQTVPALLNRLASGDEIPVAAYFAPDIPGGYVVDVSLKTALPLEEAASNFLTVNMTINSIDTEGNTAYISAVIPNTDEINTADSIWVALIAYDRKGSIVGLRRLELSPVTEGGEDLAVKAHVYSNSEDIQSVKVLAEAIVSKTE